MKVSEQIEAALPAAIKELNARGYRDVMYDTAILWAADPVGREG
jgi:hypothetical protein